MMGSGNKVQMLRGVDVIRFFAKDPESGFRD
jgi:hypothetical protein